MKIEACELPVGFRRLDYLDLTDWDGAPRNHRLDRLLDELEQKTGRAPNLDLKAVRAYEATWRRFGALSLKVFALDKPLDASEWDRRLPEPKPPGENGGNGLLIIAAQEWPAVRDSRDIARLRRFEASFAGTYYAGEAQALREALEAEAARLVEEARAAKAKEDRWRAEVRIKLAGVIPHGAPEGWFLPGAGKTEWFQDFDGGPEMVVVPAGVFMMGSPDNEPQRYSNEGPQHKVTIPRPFAIGRFPVTFEEWDAALAAGGVNHNLPDAGWGRARRPVINVSWTDANSYIAWLNGKAPGRPYRLLSEAEWEYACRAGTDTPFWWGSSTTPGQANYNGDYAYAGGGAKGEYCKKTVPVESFAANPWGLHQVHGNIWEWCEDCWNKNYKDKPDNLAQTGGAWTTGDCGSRALRGGTWDYDPRYLRAAVRSWFYAEVRYDDIGFRVARTF